MSLEEALALNTAAATRLADLIGTWARITEDAVHKIDGMTVNVTTSDLAVEAAAVPAKRKPGRPPKAAAVPEAPAPAPAPEPTPEPEPAPAAAAALDYASDVRPVLISVSKHVSGAALTGLLNGFGVDNGKALTPDQYPAIVDAARKLIAEAA